MPQVAIALGSNLGDRHGHLTFAIERLRQFVRDVCVSSFYETEPVGVTGLQPPFLNAAAIGTTDLPARELLAKLLEIESARGRTRPYAGAARILDLDLILYGENTIEEAQLQVPHPRFRERRFVLEPLAEIAADWTDPITKKAIATLLQDLPAP